MSFCEAEGFDPMTPTVETVARFGQARLVGVTLAQRHATLRALRQVTGHYAPFTYPYPLLTRWISVASSVPEVMKDLAAEPDHRIQGTVSAFLFLRAKAKDTFEVSERNVASIHGRAIPMTARVAGWLRQAPQPLQERYLGGYRVMDLHAALAAELLEHGVPETTQMALYGRQSAMVYRVAKHRIGWFRRPLK